MRTALLLLAILAIPAFANQTVWKWVDSEGVTHYSDRAVPGATKMEIASGDTSNAVAPKHAEPDVAPTSTDPREGSLYRNFEIWKPASDESFVNTGGVVQVNLRIEPALKAGHDLSLYFDGRLVQDFPSDATSYELQEVPRGSHTVIAVINDSRGTRVQETESVRFIVRQESVAKPPVGPALRPPPKPRPRAGNKQLKQQPSYAALNGARAPIDPATNAPKKSKPKKPRTLPAPKGGG